jgi:Hint domain
MATFTWTLTTPGGTTAWTTPADWVDIVNDANPAAAGFTTAPGYDYLVNTSNLFTINDIGPGGTAMPDIANSLTVSDVQATLLFADGGAFDIATTLSLSGLLNLGSTVTGGGDSTLSMGSSGAAGGTITLASFGRIEGGLGDSIQNLGTSPTEISGSGTILANDGIFNIGTGVQIASTGAANMTFSISPNATLSFADAVGGGTVVFSAGSVSGVLDVGDLSAFNPTGIKNLHVGVGAGTETTVIDFINAGTSATATLSNQSTTGATLNVFADGTSHAIPLIGNFTTVAGEPGKSVNVNYLSDGIGGIDVFLTDAPCFAAGTRVLTPRGEVAVENLAIGDLVITLSREMKPIKWIGRRSYSGRFALGQKHILPICIKAGALDESVPQRDLWISPHHAMYLDSVLIEAKDLVNGVSIVQAERVEKVEYFHIELETHDVIIAEGALSESFIDDDDRNMFHNAHEYRTLYPNASVGPARYCAPRRDDGYEVEAARRRIDARAGRRHCMDERRLGLRGLIDEVSPRRIAGWAQNVAHPEAPVCLDIYAGDRLIGQVLANRYREDLELAGLGSGRHSFEFKPPAGLTFAPNAVEVRRSLDGAALGLSSEATRISVRPDSGRFLFQDTAQG